MRRKYLFSPRAQRQLRYRLYNAQHQLPMELCRHLPPSLLCGEYHLGQVASREPWSRLHLLARANAVFTMKRAYKEPFPPRGHTLTEDASHSIYAPKPRNTDQHERNSRDKGKTYRQTQVYLERPQLLASNTVTSETAAAGGVLTLLNRGAEFSIEKGKAVGDIRKFSTHQRVQASIAIDSFSS